MKFLTLTLFSVLSHFAYSQTLQLHYDLRHAVDPKRNPKNFPTIYFEYFKTQDSGKSFVKPGSFLLKMQADFLGEKNNMNKFFMQVSQSFRFWKPPVFLSLQYSGGLGVTEPKQYSYYIMNTFSAGLAYPFKWSNAYLSSVLDYKYIPYKKPSHDILFTLYWWKGYWNYKVEFSGDFSIWTENKNHGDEYTRDLVGKKISFFAEPQLWFKIRNTVSMGTKINIYYHVLTSEDILQVYPTLAARIKL